MAGNRTNKVRRARTARATKTGPRLRRDRAGGKLRHLRDAWPEVMARVRNAEFRYLLLDFDGTLVKLQRRPEDVRLSRRAKEILRRLVRCKKFSVAVVSGRDLKSIERLVAVDGIRCVGSHGAERRGRSMALSWAAQRAIAKARSVAGKELKALPGIEIEDKGLSFAVHYRGARRGVAETAGRALRRILLPMKDTLRILRGHKVWEVLPREIPGKGIAVLELYGKLPEPKIALYFGDDQTDEEAFAALPGQITVKVGSGRSTRAGFYVRGPAEVLQLLSRLEKELG